MKWRLSILFQMESILIPHRGGLFWGGDYHGAKYPSGTLLHLNTTESTLFFFLSLQSSLFSYLKSCLFLAISLCWLWGMGLEWSEYRINVLLCCFFIVNCCELYCGSWVSNLLCYYVVLSMCNVLVHKIILFWLLTFIRRQNVNLTKKKKRKKKRGQKYNWINNNKN